MIINVLGLENHNVICIGDFDSVLKSLQRIYKDMKKANIPCQKIQFYKSFEFDDKLFKFNDVDLINNKLKKYIKEENIND